MLFVLSRYADIVNEPLSRAVCAQHLLLVPDCTRVPAGGVRAWFTYVANIANGWRVARLADSAARCLKTKEVNSWRHNLREGARCSPKEVSGLG